MAHTLGLNCVSDCELQIRSPVACKALSRLRRVIGIIAYQFVPTAASLPASLDPWLQDVEVKKLVGLG